MAAHARSNAPTILFLDTRGEQKVTPRFSQAEPLALSKWRSLGFMFTPLAYACGSA